MPAVALLGPRQAGKTTLAQEIGEGRDAHYLDLESDTGRARLADPEAYLGEHADHLVTLDEVQRMPDLFQNLRGLIDQPLTYAAIEGRARKIRTKAGIEGASLHGLRKNATIELAEAGCSNAQIKAITNYETDAMVDHYASGARQKVLAREARSKTRKNENG